jgi:phosphate transport system permease protein
MRPPAREALLRPRERAAEWLIEQSIRASAFAVIASLGLIFIFIGKEALPVLTSAEVHQEVDLGRLFVKQTFRPGEPARFSWQPVSDVPQYSIAPLFLGTLKVSVVALLIGLPLALGAAIFSSEFAPRLLREFVKPVIELLAGLPSVVVGFFIFMVLSVSLQELTGWTLQLNAVSAGIGLSLAVIPVVFTVAEDALSAVPQPYRDGALALGASRWQVAWRVVFPAALPGVFAACVLGFGRAIGETMIVLMASGNAATTSLDPRESFRSLSATVAAELGEVVHGSPHYHVLFFIGAFLFVFTFVTNLAGHAYVTLLKARLQGKA